MEQAIHTRDEAQHALAVFDMAIADAARQMETDEDAFRADVRAIIRKALGSADDGLLDRVKTPAPSTPVADMSLDELDRFLDGSTE